MGERPHSAADQPPFLIVRRRVPVPRIGRVVGSPAKRPYGEIAVEQSSADIENALRTVRCVSELARRVDEPS
jgi:hypothetical protein